MLKIGLVGVGGISRAHIAAWEEMPDVELAALCDIRQERLDLYPTRRHYLEFDEMLKNEELDILDICLPTYLHADFAVKAMNRGINVITEKPISLKEEDVERVYSAAAKNNVKFMVAQVLRFWPEYELLKELYDTQTYGKLLSGNMTRLGGYPKWSWDNWMRDEKRCGLVPFDLHIHDLDFIVYAFGEPKNVIRHRSRTPGNDYLHNMYEFEDFFISTEASWYAAPYPFSAGFRFQFEKALIVYSQGKCMIYPNEGEIIDLTQENTGDTGAINLPKSNAYANELRYFADCVIADSFPDKVKAEELSAVIRILNQM